MHTLFWIAVIASVGCLAVALTDLEKYKEFKIKFEKNYTDPAKDAYHFGIFQKSLREVEEHNTKYKAGKLEHGIRIVYYSDIPKDQWPVSALVPLEIINRDEDDITEIIRKAQEKAEHNV
uniref:Inhibitor_I29 domain-containing protein n=1 Tax=Panagrellus redivivus TaxID=6233 RepID=A0A7E4VLN5_PANRE